MTKKKPLIWVYRLVACLLILVGIGLILDRPLTHLMVKQNETRVLHHITRKEILKNQKKPTSYDFKSVKDLSLSQVLDARFKGSAPVVGALSIPAVKMNLPILKGLSSESLSSGGATMKSDQRLGIGNYPLAGHYMTAKGILFSPLAQVKLGQNVYLTDLKHVYRYQIYFKKIVPPTATWLVEGTKENIVTLITCADGGQNRWAVRGKLIQTMPATKANLGVFKL